jgi:phage gp29-like protein
MAKKETIRFEIKSDNKLELPKISLSSALNALRNEDFETLLPLYSVFLDRDGHLTSEFNKRRMQLLSVPYLVESDDKSTQEFLEEYLKNIGFDLLLYSMSLAIPYGFTCLDMVYDSFEVNKKAYFAPKTFYTIHPRYFRYKDGKLLLKQNSSTQIDPLVTPQKFLMHFHPSDSGEIGDYALMRKMLFTCLLKHATITSNMNYYENLGVPPIIIQYDSADKDEIRSILQQVQNLRSGSAGIFPKESLITLLEGKGAKPDFLAFIKYCDETISNLILGNTLSGNVQPSGSYALGKVHDDRRKDYLSFDLRLLSVTVERFLTQVLTLCFAKPASFKFLFDDSDEADEQSLSLVYKNLYDAGFEIPVEHIEKIFKIEGVTKRSIEDMLPSAKEPNARARSKPLDKIDAGLSELNIPNNISAKLERILQRCATYEEAYDILLRDYEGAEFDKLEDELTNAIANAKILGTLNA